MSLGLISRSLGTSVVEWSLELARKQGAGKKKSNVKSVVFKIHFNNPKHNAVFTDVKETVKLLNQNKLILYILMLIFE